MYQHELVTPLLLLAQTVLLAIVSFHPPHYRKKSVRQHHVRPVPSPPVHGDDSLEFRNITTKAYNPEVYVSPRLWSAISRESWALVGVSNGRSLGETTRLAIDFLMNAGCDNEQELIETVESLVKEVQLIAENCLDSPEVGAARFEPHVVRELQLVKYLGGTVTVTREEARRGTLLYYRIHSLGEGEQVYKLAVRTEQPIDGLPIVHFTVSSRDWFQGSGGVKFEKKRETSDMASVLAELLVMDETAVVLQPQNATLFFVFAAQDLFDLSAASIEQMAVHLRPA
ncbi:hypothetical protein EJ04DRAFT_569415 [Polyplosphaeria fusca]|uniref:Uncharacterized protein n=1 Tax=Polyplosphaeria fusca TaxID=682080 RepID=A0A9P4QL80_9PLEO|nr:hypothetical protein EJ04DRAFT_569415 [Polyplosphaeria fusca]